MDNRYYWALMDDGGEAIPEGPVSKPSPAPTTESPIGPAINAGALDLGGC
jgi:hypothetical protein